MKKILFPTDFSPVAHNAFSYAIHLADQFGAELILFHAFHYDATGEFYISAELIERANLEHEEYAYQEFEKYAERVKKELKKEIPITYKISYSFAVDGIISALEDTQADAIVMGTLGAGNAIEKFFGSVTSKIIENVSVPVWAIPADANYHEFHKVLYATNFEETSMHLPPLLNEFSQRFDSKLTYIHINKKAGDPWNRLSTNIKRDLLLSNSAENDPEFYILHEPRVWPGLQHFMDEHETDLLVLLTHKHDLLERITQGSLTRKAVLSSKVPLLALHQ